MKPSSTPLSPPHRFEAERTVLGALLLDPQAMPRVAAIIEAADFFDPVLRRIFAGCQAIYARGAAIDIITVSAELAADEFLERIGGEAFLAALAEGVPTASHVEHYARIVREASLRRALLAAGERIAELAREEQPVGASLEAAHAALLSVAGGATTGKPEPIGAVAERRYDEIARIQQSGATCVTGRVKTGYSNLDYYFNGFAPGSLTVLAARPSMGKTALALGIAVNAARAGQRVLYFSLEMTKEELADRLTAAGLGVSTWQLDKGDVTDEQVSQLGQVIDDLQALPLHLDDDADSSLTNVRAKSLAHKLEHGLDLVIVDYLQLVELPREARAKENRVQEISTISRGLKQLARELGAPVIALSQLNRAVESAPQAIPHLAHLRESGSIEQDAHNVLMLWREGYYHEDCAEPDVTTVFIRKNRQGPVGAAELHFNSQLMTFTPVERRRMGERSA